MDFMHNLYALYFLLLVISYPTLTERIERQTIQYSLTI